MYFLNENLFSCYFLNFIFKIIDYLIFYLKKYIWINLEFYFESMNFLIFIQFFCIFLNLFWNYLNF